MTHGTDKRLSSRRWKELRLRVLRRDHYRCQIRLPDCLERADQVDHIIPREWGGPVWDMSNLQAGCGPCNRKREHLGDLSDSERATVTAMRRRRDGAFFSERDSARGRLANLPPHHAGSPQPTIAGDYSRSATAVADRPRDPQIAEGELG